MTTGRLMSPIRGSLEQVAIFPVRLVENFGSFSLTVKSTLVRLWVETTVLSNFLSAFFTKVLLTYFAD